MANPGYVRSTDGNDADNGSTWALANASSSGAAADAVAGDRIWFSQAHAETQSTALSVTFPGTDVSPNVLLCGNDGTEPPTAITTGASITTTTNAPMTFNGNFRMEGIAINCGTGGSSNNGISLAVTAGNQQSYKNCTFRLIGTSSNQKIVMGQAASTNPGRVTFLDCVVSFSNANQSIRFGSSRNRIENLSFESGTTTPTTIFEEVSQRCVDALVVGGDFTSNLGSGFSLFAGGTGNKTGGLFLMYGAKMPSGWTGDIRATPSNSHCFRAEMHACHSADGMYYERASDAYGKAREETTFIRSGGRTVPNSESGGTNPLPLSIKMDAVSHLAAWPNASFVFEVSPIWNTTVGSSVTVTVPILMDSASEWNDNDIVLRLSYPGTSGETRYSCADSGPGSVIASTTDLSTKFGSSSGWTTTGMTNPKQRQLQVTVTPQEIGFIKCEILLFKQAVVYVDKATAA